MGDLEKLLANASAAVSLDDPLNDGGFIGELEPLVEMLSHRNGFYALESALHVFPMSRAGLPGRSLLEWNDPALWRGYFGSDSPDLVFFAEDLFGGQFGLVTRDGAVQVLNPETGVVGDFAENVHEWASRIVSDYNFVTGYSVGHDWQAINGALPIGHRLIPRIPFVCGGGYAASNMVPVEAVAAMRYMGRFSHEISSLSDGEQFRFDPCEVEELRCLAFADGDEGRCRCAIS